VTDYDYQVVVSDGNIHNYIWDDNERKMVEGKREKIPPYWRINRIAEDLYGKVEYITAVDSRGKITKKIVISYEEDDSSTSLR